VKHTIHAGRVDGAESFVKAIKSEPRGRGRNAGDKRAGGSWIQEFD
jgi:hypothetical protein